MLVAVLIIAASINQMKASELFSISDGKWSDGNIWSYERGGIPCGCVPISSSVVHVEHNILLDKNLTGGSKILGTIEIVLGKTLNGPVFNVDFDNGSTGIILGTLNVKDLTLYNITTITLSSSGIINVNGSFTNKNNSTTININGVLNVYGEFRNLINAEIYGSGIINYYGPFTDNGFIDGVNDNISQIIMGSPLPITMAEIKIKCTETGSLLSWTTQAEINNNYFTIEKSTNMADWKIVSTIKGSFNSNQMQKYAYLDSQSNDITTYYRIKQTDLDGKYEYFDALSILCKLGNNQLEISGINVSESYTNVILKTNGYANVSINIIDIYGRVISSMITAPTEGANICKIKTGSMKPGIYIVEAEQGYEKVSKKVFLQ